MQHGILGNAGISTLLIYYILFLCHDPYTFHRRTSTWRTGNSSTSKGVRTRISIFLTPDNDFFTPIYSITHDLRLLRSNGSGHPLNHDIFCNSWASRDRSNQNSWQFSLVYDQIPLQHRRGSGSEDLSARTDIILRMRETRRKKKKEEEAD